MSGCAGDYLRIWQLKENGAHLIKLLNNVSGITLAVCYYTLHHLLTTGSILLQLQHQAAVTHAITCLQLCIHSFRCFLQNKNSEFSAPLTSFDWNETDLNRLGTSSIDTTCTIWDIEVSHITTTS